MRVVRLVLRFLSLSFLAPVVLALSGNAYAYHVKYRWPDQNFYWMSNRIYHGASNLQVRVISNICDFAVQEQSAIANAIAQTVNMPELGDMKGLGYNFQWGACNTSPDDFTDIFLSYEDPYPYGDEGGFTVHNLQAPEAWCRLWGTYYKCGDHWVTIHLNLPTIRQKSDDWIVRLLMHEMGHATGLDEHCTDASGNPSDAIMNDGTLTCNNGNWIPMQWQPTDRQGLYAAYHPFYGESTESWSSAWVISDGIDLGIYNLTNPAVDVDSGGRMFIGLRNDKVYNEQWEMAWSDDGVTWQRATHGAYLYTVNNVAAMLAHSGGLSIYAVFCCNGYPGYPSNTYQIYRQTWNGVWQGTVLEYSAGTSSIRCCVNTYPRVAHSRDHSQYAIAWSRTVSGVPLAEFSFIDGATGSFTGGVEAIDAFVVQALVFDDSGNPKVIYRVSGTGTSGIGGRRTRVNGVWQPEEQFVIDGMTDPDAVLLVEGEGGHWSGSNATHGDYHALQQSTDLTFNYMKRLNGAYFQSAVDFRALPNPITGPNTANYSLHGVAHRIYARQAYSVGVVWTYGSCCGSTDDLWFIKRRVEGY